MMTLFTQSTVSRVVIATPSFYRKFVGTLQYLTFTRPDISYAVQQLSVFMHDLREPHFNSMKCVLRYLLGTLCFGMHLYSTSASGLIAYSDADWGGCPGYTPLYFRVLCVSWGQFDLLVL